jgi:hypothetical protein
MWYFTGCTILDYKPYYSNGFPEKFNAEAMPPTGVGTLVPTTERDAGKQAIQPGRSTITEATLASNQKLTIHLFN